MEPQSSRRTEPDADGRCVPPASEGDADAFAARPRKVGPGASRGDRGGVGSALREAVGFLDQRAADAWLGHRVAGVGDHDQFRLGPGAMEVPRGAGGADDVVAALADHRRNLPEALGVAEKLVVGGEAESGKSYSLQYIGYLAEVERNFSFTALDMERVPRTDQNKVAPAGLVQAITQALKPGGRVTFWSASTDHAFSKRLTKAGFKVETVAAKAYPQAKRSTHTIFVADRK